MEWEHDEQDASLGWDDIWSWEPFSLTGQSDVYIEITMKYIKKHLRATKLSQEDLQALENKFPSAEDTADEAAGSTADAETADGGSTAAAVFMYGRTSSTALEPEERTPDYIATHKVYNKRLYFKVAWEDGGMTWEPFEMVFQNPDYCSDAQEYLMDHLTAPLYQMHVCRLPPTPKKSPKRNKKGSRTTPTRAKKPRAILQPEPEPQACASPAIIEAPEKPKTPETPALVDQVNTEFDEEQQTAHEEEPVPSIAAELSIDEDHFAAVRLLELSMANHALANGQADTDNNPFVSAPPVPFSPSPLFPSTPYPFSPRSPLSP